MAYMGNFYKKYIIFYQKRKWFLPKPNYHYFVNAI